MLISILGTISKLFFGKNLNIATVNEEKNLAIYPSNDKYSCVDLGGDVEKFTSIRIQAIMGGVWIKVLIYMDLDTLEEVVVL